MSASLAGHRGQWPGLGIGTRGRSASDFSHGFAYGSVYRLVQIGARDGAPTQHFENVHDVLSKIAAERDGVIRGASFVRGFRGTPQNGLGGVRT